MKIRVGDLGTFSALALAACSAATPPAAPVVDPSAAVASASAIAAPSAPAPAAPATPAEPAKVCSKDGDLDTCHARCAERDAAACELVGDMLVVEDNPDAPIKGYHVGSALRAFDQACSLGAAGACAKRDLHLKDLRSACAKSAKNCTLLGRALLQKEGHDSEADATLARACQAGDAEACAERGAMHAAWEPKKQHQAISERAHDRACSLGSSTSCCGLANLYRETSQDQKAGAALTRMEAAQAKESGRFSCDYSAARGRRSVRSKAKLDAAVASALSKAEVSTLEEVLSRRVGDCYRVPPVKSARLELSLLPDAAAKLTSLTPGDEQACVASVVEELHLGRTASPRVAFTVDFETVTGKDRLRSTE